MLPLAAVIGAIVGGTLMFGTMILHEVGVTNVFRSPIANVAFKTGLGVLAATALLSMVGLLTV